MNKAVTKVKIAENICLLIIYRKFFTSSINFRIKDRINRFREKYRKNLAQLLHLAHILDLLSDAL